MTMYEDQVMDNLIRANINQGFVQLKYSDLLVQVTDQHVGQIANSQTLTSSTQFNIAAPVTTALGLVSHSFQNLFSLQGNAARLGQMSFHADPVTDSNDVYSAYVEFAKNPAFFSVTDYRPKKCDYHVMREQAGHYYWVPVTAASHFQDLFLKTTFMRGPETIPPGYYECKVIRAVKNPANPGDNTQAMLKLDKQIPPDTGRMILSPATGGRMELHVEPLTTKDPDTNKDAGSGDQSAYIIATWRVADPINVEGLGGATVRIYLDHYSNPSFPVPTDVQQIRQGVDRVRSALSPFLKAPGF